MTIGEDIMPLFTLESGCAIALTVVLAILLFHILSPKSQERTSNERTETELVEEIIRKRRSIFPKDFSPDADVPKNVIQKILECANWAPTHGKTEPWGFVVLDREGVKKFNETIAIFINCSDQLLYMLWCQPEVQPLELG